jgi:hypothetical protein
MTEAEGRALLRQYPGARGIEVWISLQPWQSAPNGWTVARDLEGWSFQLTLVPGGLQVTAVVPGNDLAAVWPVLAQG